jgi:D-serine dehydratase
VAGEQLMPPRAETAAPFTRAATSLDLSSILAQPIDWQYKAFPVTDEPVQIGAAGAQGWNALQPPFSAPVMVLKDSALQHNIDLMAAYCSARNISLAPHVKTPLSPQIADRQLAAGAWGLTVANIHQARVLRCAGARRLIVANEVTDPASASWLARELDQDPGLEIYCLVDSMRGAALLDGYLAAAGLHRQLAVLIELGIPGARCGCRDIGEAFRLAGTLTRLKHLRLAGVEVYENQFPAGSAEETISRVDHLFDGLRELVGRLDAEHLLDGVPEILVSGGGSMWFDRVAVKLGGPWNLSRPVRTVIRAGSYVTHDGALYKEFSPLDGRSSGPLKLQQALELWASVISRPEPDLAILNFGKRDAAHDRGFPVPFEARTKEGTTGLRAADHVVLSLNDQHARLALPADSQLAVGDLVGSHISHPCTSFDNWRLVPLVSSEYDVIGAVRSYL